MQRPPTTDDLVAALHRAAERVPVRPPDTTDVRRRAARYRRRQTAVLVAVPVAAALATALTLPRLARDDGAVSTAAPPTCPAAIPATEVGPETVDAATGTLSDGTLWTVRVGLDDCLFAVSFDAPVPYAGRSVGLRREGPLLGETGWVGPGDGSSERTEQVGAFGLVDSSVGEVRLVYPSGRVATGRLGTTPRLPGATVFVVFGPFEPGHARLVLLDHSGRELASHPWPIEAR